MFARRLGVRLVAGLCVLACTLAVDAGSAGASPGQFGNLGEGAGEYYGSRGVAVDQATGYVYLMDFGNVRIDKWTGEGSFLLAWGWGVANAMQGLQTCTTTCYQGSSPDYGPGTGEFGLGVGGVAVDNDPLSPSYEDVYVPDAGNNRVEKFDPSGGFLAMFGREVNENGSNICLAGEKCQPGKEGGAGGEFDDITGAIAVASNGNVYVGGNERVQVFGPEGVFFKQFTVAGGTLSIAVDQSGDLFVVNEGSPHVLSEYDSSGVLLRTLDGEGEPQAIALDAPGDVFVDDLTRSNPASRQHHLLEYGPGGEELSSFDPGSIEADGTQGIAIGESAGAVYVPNGKTVRVVDELSSGPELVGQVSVSGVEPLEATLNATIDPENETTTYRFEYGLTGSYDLTVPSPEGSLPASFGDEPISATIAKLTPDTTYHYRIVATDSKGHTTTGPDETFTTPTAVLVDSEFATNVASTSATIGGELNPLGVEATYHIEYDTSGYIPGDSSHGTSLATAPLGSGTNDVPINTHIDNLLPDTLYHYHIVAHDTREGIPYTTDGPDRTFLTQPAKSSLVLPDGRQWEQVSPLDKQGAALKPSEEGGVAIQASVDGNGITYIANAATETEPSGNRNPESTQLLSLREAGGWSTRGIDTPNDPGKITGFRLNGGSEYRLFSSDLSVGLLEPRTETPLPPLPRGAENTLYLRDDRNGAYEPLVTTDNVVAGAKFSGHGQRGSELIFLDATPGLSHIVFSSPVALTPDAVENGSSESLYEWVGGKLTLVSILPDEQAASKTGSAELGFRDGILRHAVSDDGSRIFWQDDSNHLYLRDMVRNETVQVDAAQGVADPDTERSQFATASSDGSRVFFTSAAHLTADSTVFRAGSEADLYVFEVTSDSGKPLRGRLTDLTVDETLGENADVQGVIGASEDGTSIFFAAKGLLGGGVGRGVAGATYLYMEHFDRTTRAWSAPRLISALSSADSQSWGVSLGGRLSDMTSRVSPNGRFLAFMSARSLTGYDNRGVNSGVADEEVFLYDAVAERLSCVSCDPTGARPAGVLDRAYEPVDESRVWTGSWLAGLIPDWSPANLTHAIYQPRYLSDSGRVFFESFDALVPSDTNGRWDVYEFEPQGVGDCTSSDPSFEARSGGCVGLISSGGSAEDSVFLDASETGDDAFFLTESGLSLQDGDGLFDVYDARVCSPASPCLSAAPAAPPVCSTGDSCKATATPQPASFGAPASQTFSGVGNTHAAPGRAVVSKSLTRAQKLSRALRACAKKSRRKRSACKRQARERFGTDTPAKRSKVNKSLPVRAGH